MASLVLTLICALCVYSANGNIVKEKDGSSQAWQKRINSAVTLLQSCRGLSRGHQCDPSTFANLDTRTVRLYTAQAPNLRVVLPERRLRRLTSHRNDTHTYDAVFVLDPYPEANFGHVVFIFLVNFDVNRTACSRRLNGEHVFTGRDECIRRAEKRNCANLHRKQVKCEVDFIPLVYSENDQTQTQLLQCHQRVKTLSFAKCGAQEDFPARCRGNSARCTDGARPDAPYGVCRHEMCDHGVLVSGGWDPFTSRPHYRKNLHHVWKLLHSVMRYEKDKIVTFFGQGQKDELAEHQRDHSYAVNSPTGVKEYIKKLCQSRLCVDTLTIYLTGPSKSDGSLLFWDNGNGLTEDSEIYKPRDLLDDVRNCTAKRVFIVADYSYSGALINKIINRMTGRHPEQYKNIVAISSTSWNEYSWRSDFTDSFVKHNKEGTTTKCVTDVIEDIKKESQTAGFSSTPQTATGANSNATYTTFTGRRCNETWASANAVNQGCRRWRVAEWTKEFFGEIKPKD